MTISSKKVFPRKISQCTLAATAAAMLFLAGCGHESGGAIVVLDLGRIATETGQDDVIRQKAEAGQLELNTQLQALAERLDADIVAEREKAGLLPGMAPAEADAARMQQMTNDARQQIMQAQQKAQQRAQQLQSELVVEFRDALMPAATKIAAERGASVILSKDAYIFWADDAADISDAVIAAWNAEQSVVEPTKADPVREQNAEAAAETAVGAESAADIATSEAE